MKYAVKTNYDDGFDQLLDIDIGSIATNFSDYNIERTHDENYYSNEKKTLIPIKINASFAFGSGYHETTKNCIHAISLVTRKRQIKNFLDYGSGSGILGICMNKKIKKLKSNILIMILPHYR